MGDLSRYFDRTEFRCRCGCRQDTVDAGLLRVLETVRRHFGAPVTINSGNRCPSYNASIKGSPHSQHMRSRAADFVVKGIPPQEVYDYLNDWHDGGLGLYSTFVHVDSRGKKARWDNTNT